MVCTLEDKDSRRGHKSIYGTHLQSLWRKYQDLDGQQDRIQKQTLQGSRGKVRYRIFNSFTPLQTTEQWKNRMISQIPETMYW